MRALLLFLAMLLTGAPTASAQSSWSYRVRFTAEQTSTAANRLSPLALPLAPAWGATQLFVASADGVWTPGDRWRIGGAGTVKRSGAGASSGRWREGYVRLSATSWMDVEAGKRLVRWGVAYGFSPAGVLDPPRRATDPSDRLQTNEGRLLARSEMFRGSNSLTIAVADGVQAVRLAGLLKGGLEAAAIATAGDGHPQYGGTLTHVVGDRLEWHVEALSHERGGHRAVSAAAGAQYTFPSGLNVVLEYHRNGRNLLFFRAAHSAADVKVTPELIVIAGLDDNGWTWVPSVTWTPHRHVQAYLRLTHLAGPARSLVRMAPFSTAATAGASVRF